MRTGCGALAFRPPHKEKSRIRHTRGWQSS